ncbi:MAG: MBL fold metallo-hydrolase [Bacillota bacterium]
MVWSARRFLSWTVLVLLLLALSPGCRSAAPPGAVEEPSVQQGPGTTCTPAEGSPVKGELSIHFIDVGQGDSILVLLPTGETILVDAGDNGLGPAIVQYLKDQGVTRVDYLVATHPHADHLGGMPDVIKSFDIGEVYMPRTTHTTQTYERLLLAVREKGLRITEARAGVVLFDLPNLRAVLVAPVSSGYQNVNDWSAVLRIEYGDTAFLFAGDAEAKSEEEMISSGVKLAADVLKVGHHGSGTSTTPGFLTAVSPAIAVISVGAGNRYGHPAPETLARLESTGTEVYRTDLHGTVKVVSDGNSVMVQTKKEPAFDGAGPSCCGPEG